MIYIIKHGYFEIVCELKGMVPESANWNFLDGFGISYEGLEVPQANRE